jgi:hypothetical protein
MKRAWIVSLSVIAVLLLVGLHFTRTSHTPVGQPALVDLRTSQLSTLQDEFNRESANTRVILLLSPTCPTCLQGASTVENILKRHPHSQIVVFAVWEPMLPTDWSKPGTSVLQRLSDNRVRQFWDFDHTVASALKATQETGQLHPNCCNRNGVLWDLIAAFPRGDKWSDTLPLPLFFDGTVVRSASGLESLMINPN